MKVPFKSAEEAAGAPWDYPMFLMVPGRYYHGMVNLCLYPKVSDLTGLLWRYDSTPHEWIFTYRMRCYATPDPWGKGDTRNWNATKSQGDEAKARAQANVAMAEIAAVATILSGQPALPDWMEIKGDQYRAIDIIQRSPRPWMHVKTGTVNPDGTANVK